MKFTPREAICQYMGWDFSEASDYRYQYGRSSLPVYSSEASLVCAVANGKNPPKTDSTGFAYGWKEATGSTAEWCKNNGYTVWLSSDPDAD